MSPRTQALRNNGRVQTRPFFCVCWRERALTSNLFRQRKPERGEAAAAIFQG